MQNERTVLFLAAILFLVAFSFGIEFAVRRLRKVWLAIWRLIDPKTMPPCPRCGKDTERHKGLWLCRSCLIADEFR